jgi:arylsulfatase A-like enzyme
VWTGWSALRAIAAERYGAIGFDHLSTLTVRDTVAERLPWLIAGVPILTALWWLARRPRGLASLVTLVPFLLVLLLRFDAINEALKSIVARREARGLVLVTIVCAGALLSLGIAGLFGRFVRSRRSFETGAAFLGALGSWAARVPGLGRLFHPVSGVLVWVAALAALVVPSLTAPTPSGPSFVIILVDTLRADHTTPYGYHRPTTPRLEAWSQQASVFEAAVAQASWTKPSLASIFTSLMPSVHCTGSGISGRRSVVGTDVVTVPAPANAPITGGTLPRGLVTMAEVFRQHGYRTAGFVANSLVSKRDGYGQGFEVYETLDDRRITEAAKRWLVENAGKPSFLYLHYMAPHAPYDPPKAFDVFGPGSGLVDIFNSATKDSINFTNTRNLGPDEVAWLINQYDGEILYADSQLGQIFDTITPLERSGRFVVAVTADHGEEFLDHGMVWHESIHLYQELTRIPFVVRLPDQEAGVRLSDPVMHIDLAPTLLELADLPVPETMQGRSLVPFLRGEKPAPRGAYAETVDWGEKQAVWLDHVKMICDREDPGLELFRLDEDPAEQHDLSGTLADLRAALLDSLNEVSDRNARILSRVGVEASGLHPEQIERLRSLGYIQ